MLWKGLIDWYLKYLELFLRFKVIRAQLPPSPPHTQTGLAPPTCIQQIFLDSILFKIVQRSDNKAFDVDTNHQSLWARVAYDDPGAFKVLGERMAV